MPKDSDKQFVITEGEVEPIFNKKVETLIMEMDEFFVYIDVNLDIQWQCEVAIDEKVFGTVLNKVALLDESARFIEDRAVKLGVKRQIAEGLARCFQNMPDQSEVILGAVEEEIKALNASTSWGWYFEWAYYLTAACVIFSIVMWMARHLMIPIIGRIAFDVMLCAMAGAVGAMISTCTRTHKLNVNANAGKVFHRTESLARIIAGVTGAALVALSIKGGLMLGGLFAPGNQLAAMLAFSIAAGASERMVPNVISKIETSLEGKGGKG